MSGVGIRWIVSGLFISFCKGRMPNEMCEGRENPQIEHIHSSTWSREREIIVP